MLNNSLLLSNTSIRMGILPPLWFLQRANTLSPILVVNQTCQRSAMCYSSHRNETKKTYVRMLLANGSSQNVLHRRAHLPHLFGSFKYTGHNSKHWLLFRIFLGLVQSLNSPTSNPFQHQFLIQIKQLVHNLPNLYQQVNCRE